jgi:hypothetical protein
VKAKFMTDFNYKSSGKRDREGNELDDLLDRSLAQYAAVEPRVGMEDRILANLRAEREEIPHRSWWQWSWAIASAVVIVGALLAWISTRPSRLQVVNHPVAAQQSLIKPAPQIALNKVGPKLKHASGVTLGRPLNRATAEEDPKLDVFPSPRPPSEEELALAQYVRNFPSEAQQVAQAQEASEREVLAKMQALASESAESN